jgi:hypothetical protein
MNPLYEPFPDFITSNGWRYGIVTDFREWIRFSDMLSDGEISEEEKLLILPEYFLEPPESVDQGMVEALFAFYRADALDPKKSGREEKEKPQPVKPPVLSFEMDAKYILSDFRRYYSMNLREVEYLHWWEFLTLLRSLPDESSVQQRIAYRSADLSQIKSRSERERVRKIQQRIALPFVYADDAIGAALGGMM